MKVFSKIIFCAILAKNNFVNALIPFIGIRKKRRAAEISRTEAMNCIPVKNLQTQESRGETGQLIICYPLEIRPWITRWIRRWGGDPGVIRTKKLQLDELGTAVWDLLDGKRSVGQVIQDFAAVQKLHPREAEVAVTVFLRELGKRGLIGMR